MTINITQAARAVLLKQLAEIANKRQPEPLQALLCGVGLPALSRDTEAAEQIHAALLESGKYADLARRIAALLARLVQRRSADLEQELACLLGTMQGNGSTEVCESHGLKDETYVFNLFLLASLLPREGKLFDAVLQFHRIGFERSVVLSSIDNRVGVQLRRALAEQQHDAGLRDYWMKFLVVQGQTWSAARRTELLDAWYGLLATLDLDADLQGSLAALDKGLQALCECVEPHPESIDLLDSAFWRLSTACPLDPATWVHYLSPVWAQWPQLLQDVAATTWPSLGATQDDEIPPLPDELADFFRALSGEIQEKLRDLLQRGADAEGRKYIQSLLFPPQKVVDLAPQAVISLLNRLGQALWPTNGSVKGRQQQSTCQSFGSPGSSQPHLVRNRAPS